MKRIIMAIVLVLLFAGMAFSLPGDIKIWTASWQANTETDLAGYKLYWSATDGGWNTTAMIDVKNVTQQVLTGVVPSNRYICVTAYDTSGNESNKSTSIFFDRDIIAPAVVGGVTIK